MDNFGDNPFETAIADVKQVKKVYCIKELVSQSNFAPFEICLQWSLGNGCLQYLWSKLYNKLIAWFSLSMQSTNKTASHDVSQRISEDWSGRWRTV